MIEARTTGPAEPFHVDRLAPGVSLRRLYPGGIAGPKGETRNEVVGGQAWRDILLLGAPDAGLAMCVLDVRMPPNQLWPMHWHDCWTMVVPLEGGCLVGDFCMEPGDVFVAAPSIEYGPLLNGPKGCRLLEIFGDIALSPGGYAEEYRDHPTLRGGNFSFKPRVGVNRRNEGHSSLSLDGAEGVWKARLAPTSRHDLGDPDDPNRGVVSSRRLAAGEKLPARTRGDWYAALVLDGWMSVAGKALVRDDVLIVEPGASAPEAAAGEAGVQLLEHFRTARAL